MRAEVGLLRWTKKNEGKDREDEDLRLSKS